VSFTVSDELVDRDASSGLLVVEPINRLWKFYLRLFYEKPGLILLVDDVRGDQQNTIKIALQDFIYEMVKFKNFNVLTAEALSQGSCSLPVVLTAHSALSSSRIQVEQETIMLDEREPAEEEDEKKDEGIRRLMIS
jgi:hypothetical protein